MMSTEFPEVLPEPFSKPCASYSGRAENFIGEVVSKGCHGKHTSQHTSLYNNAMYYSDVESSHHSLIVEDPVLGQNHLLEEDPSPNGYSQPANFQVGIKLIIKDGSGFRVEDSVSNHQMNRRHMTSIEQAGIGYMAEEEEKNRSNNLSSVEVRIECADEEGEAKKIVEQRQDLLSPPPSQRESSPFSCSGSDSYGILTPALSYRDLVSSPSIEYPGAEDREFDVRGVEVARWEEDLQEETGARGRSDYHGVAEQEKSVQDNGLQSDSFGEPCFDDQDSRLPLDVPDKLTLAAVTKQRRSHLSHLKLIRSPCILSLPTTEPRKLSDPAIHVRRQKLKSSSEPKRQRCLSDSEAPSLPFLMDEDELKSEEGCSSALGCDSGFHDERIPRFHDNAYSSPRVSLFSDFHSLEEGNETILSSQKNRRVTPHPLLEPFMHEGSQSPAASSNPGTMVHPRERSRRSLLKFSQGSIGGGSVGGNSSLGASSESPSLNSMLETQSNLTCATDILSSLGFDDFDSPQLVPDRFIPKDLDHLRPSSMKAVYIEQTFSPDPPRSPDSIISGNSSVPAPPQIRSVDLSDLPLGATAENFFSDHARPGSPTTDIIVAENDTAIATAGPSDTTPLFTDTLAIVGFTRSRILETVPEETASDLSLSPRWLSPRVSIDHSVLDLAEGKLGASLQKVRRRSLPSREGYRLSIGSLVESDTGDSIHLSVTSYDDDIAAEREREREGFMLGGMGDDITLGPGRRRRRGVYTPPQTLLSWLSTQKTIDEEVDTDPDELPWPFNEQARLRKSLTEISIAQQSALTGDSPAVAPDDENSQAAEMSSLREVSLSPISSPNASPEPSLSEATTEEDFDMRPRHLTGLSLPDSEIKPRALSPCTADGHSNNGARNSLFPSHHHTHHGASPPVLSPTHTRQRRAPISPLCSSIASFPRLGDVCRPPNVEEPPVLCGVMLENLDLKIPTTDEVKVPISNGLQLPSLSSVTPSLLFSEVGPPLAPVPGGQNCSPSGDHRYDAPTKSNQQQPHLVDANKPISIDQGKEVPHPETIPASRKTRRPRLSTLRQSSIESLAEDMSQIELLTGDLPSPVLSRKSSLKRQKSLDENLQSRRSRRVAVIGEAPNSTDLFTTTSLAENKQELGKYMVL